MNPSRVSGLALGLYIVLVTDGSVCAEMEPIATPLPEILKAYRQDYLFQEFGMVDLPFMQPALVERFKGQAACT